MTEEATSRKLLELLEALALLLKVGSPTFKNKDAAIAWNLTSKHELSFVSTDAGNSVSCTIGQLPEKNKEDFYLLTMRANFLGQGTNGHVIGMDKEEKFLTLSSKIPYDVDVKGFKNYIEDFVNYVDYWRGELSRHVTQARGLFG
jgi:hypothetical protein